MHIRAEHIGKRFNKEWIFRELNYQFESGKSYAILGSNGSGKSTLLQVVCGYARSSEGKLQISLKDKEVSAEHLFRHVSLATPYLGIYEDYYLPEMLDFHFNLKPLKKGIDLKQLPELLQLRHAINRPIKQFSSGMKQRVRLGLAILSDTPFLFLDEPTSNLDANGKAWYADLIQQHTQDRMVMVCSNHQEEEIFFCNHRLEIADYKPTIKAK